MKLRTLLLTSILTLGITITSSSQVVMDTTKRETISKDFYKNTLERINDELIVFYKNQEYKTIRDMRNFLIGDLTNYNSLREAILDGFNQPKYESKKFTLNDKYFVIQKFSKKQVWIFIYDGDIKTSMGIYNVKMINKLLPKLD